MPEKPLTIATYAVGASLAAASLLYVFGPTFALDAEGGVGSTKRGVVGLANPANDCFINSVLQVLAGLPDLRRYLIRELHRRNLDGPDVYRVTGQEAAKLSDLKVARLEGLRQGKVTRALRDILNKLNERPLHRKTISANEFIRALETAFRTKISRQQQDAHEFLQIVAERLCDEYHEGRGARSAFKRRAPITPLSETVQLASGTGSPADETDAAFESEQNSQHQRVSSDDVEAPQLAEPKIPELKTEDAKPECEQDDEEPFPFEGQQESELECQFCHFKPKPSKSRFVILTLNVPEVSQTSLNHCLDGILKVETISDFKCDRCRLEHAKAIKTKALQATKDPEDTRQLTADLELIESAIEEDPERELLDAHLPSKDKAPSRTIQRHTKISKFPKILPIHLSRSIFSANSVSVKNLAKVSFPENLTLGGLLTPVKYKLVGVVTHKGGHNSGHYETFRRQINMVPFSTPHSFGANGAFSHYRSPSSSLAPSPTPSSDTVVSPNQDVRPQSPGISHLSISRPSTPSHSSKSSVSLSSSFRRKHRPLSGFSTSTARPDSVASSQAPTVESIGVSPPNVQAMTEAEMQKYHKRQKRSQNRWWRISDDRVKESKTNDVLGFQREAYLLFYELLER